MASTAIDIAGFMSAAYSGRFDEVRKQLNDGMSPNVEMWFETINGFTMRAALHVAAISGSREVAELLIMRGADVDVVDDKGSTSALHAASRGSMGPLELLMRQKADISAIDKNGSTILHNIASSGDATTLRKFITENFHKINLNQKNKNGNTPLHYAAYSNKVENVKILLLEFHADCNIEDNYGQTPLQQAESLHYAQATVTLIKEHLKKQAEATPKKGVAGILRSCITR